MHENILHFTLNYIDIQILGPLPDFNYIHLKMDGMIICHQITTANCNLEVYMIFGMSQWHSLYYGFVFFIKKMRIVCMSKD